MQAVDRYNLYKEDDFDRIILLIRNGTIKCGRYRNLVKVDPKKQMKGKVFFDDNSDSNQGK